MENNLQLEDLVYTYPAYNDPLVQTKISAKEEFKEISGLPSEAVPKRGQLYRHQKVFNRLMRQYDNQLVIYSPGVGKSIAVISVVEYYKAIADALEELRQVSASSPNSNIPNPPFKRAYVLVRGQTLIDEFKFQIICKATNGEYITEQILNSKNERQRKSNVSRSISRFYSIMTYGTFAKYLLSLTDQQLREEMSHCIFIVDEVHNISADLSGGFLREDPLSGNKYYAHVSKGKERILESRLIYDQLWRLFHLVFPRKVMLLSATPMINAAWELGPRLNLILPSSNQIPADIDWNTVTIETLEPYFRGMISYVRALDTGAVPIYQGETLGDLGIQYDKETGEIIEKNREIEITENENNHYLKLQMIVYPTQMEPKQEKVYYQAENDPLSLRPESTKPEAFDILKQQVANFVFPDNTTGSEGYHTYVIEDKEGIRATAELEAWLREPARLRQLSCKMAEIVRLCKDQGGNCWCYSNFIIGSGANVLSLCFEAQGFQQFTESISMFTQTGEGRLPALCGNKSLDEDKNRTVRIPKRLRYALLTSKTSGPEKHALLEAFNSYENRHGEYIKVIIGSPTTQEGINLANVLQIHLLGPDWNQAGTYQAESRAIRSTSHVDLINEERERLLLLGQNPDDATVEIKVYRHAAIREEAPTVDIDMYATSEMKDRQIKRIMRMMKQIAIDCQINYKRNVRPGDIDGSAVCDYDVCAYKCYSPVPDYIDLTSYDVLYSSQVIQTIKEEIIDIFRLIFQITIDQLYNELSHLFLDDSESNLRRKFVDIAVTELIEKKTPIYNRYGYLSYLREDRGTIFLRNDFPLGIFEKPGAVSTVEYTSNIIGLMFESLEDYTGTLQRGSGNIFDIFADLDRQQVNQKLDTLTLQNQILICESAITNYYVNKDENDLYTWIIDKYRNHIFINYEPVVAIEMVQKAISERGKGRGRKPKEGSKFKLTSARTEEINEVLSEVGRDIIYYHNLANLTQALTSHNIAAKAIKAEGKIRLLNPSEGVGWRDANEAEEIVYNMLISKQMEEKQPEEAIYGTILQDGKFRIVDKTTEEEAAKSTGVKADRRKLNRGRVCSTWKKPELLNLLWKLGFNPFNININLSRKELISFIVNQKIVDRETAEGFLDDQLKFYYTWASSGASIQRICGLLQDEFRNTNRLK